jgi:hypothetical protein
LKVRKEIYVQLTPVISLGIWLTNGEKLDKKNVDAKINNLLFATESFNSYNILSFACTIYTETIIIPVNKLYLELIGTLYMQGKSEI